MGNICGGTVIVVHERDVDTVNAIHEEAIDSKKQQIEELESRIVYLNAVNVEYAEKVAQLESISQQLDERNKTLLAENSTLRTDSAIFERESEQKVSFLEKQIADLKSAAATAAAAAVVTPKRETNNNSSSAKLLPPLPSTASQRPISNNNSAIQTPKTLRKIGTAEINFGDLYTPKSTTEFSETDLYHDPVAGSIDGYLDDHDDAAAAYNFDAVASGSCKRWSNGTTDSAYVGFDNENVYSARSSCNFQESDLHYDAVAGLSSPYEEQRKTNATAAASNTNSSSYSNSNSSGYNSMRNGSNDENHNYTNTSKKNKQQQEKKKRESASVEFEDVYDRRASSNTFGFAQKR